ncbi:putative SOS response-associated peptidase YedK [mine drainage metagenome]|uniref:Putative SOS response-associated peptidase YedK n=1 Tax=mine drainage metagenome TaxID=410659 RepID=A0A1J5SUD8_9ZZZZ
MCYDVSFTVNIKQLSDYFPDLIFDDQIEINFEAAIHVVGHAYGNHPIIYVSRDDLKLHCRLMEWGVIPFWIKDESAYLRQRATMLNARSERILGDEKSYWYKIRNRRCLIPVSGIYEHRAIKGWKKKVPYFIKSINEQIIFLPGLYSVVELPDKETGELIKRYTYTLITRAANKVMSQIHNDGENSFRMPLFLPFELSKKWLQEDLSNDEFKAILDYELPSEDLEYYPVYTIRSAKERPDNKLKNEYYEWDKLPALGEMNP